MKHAAHELPAMYDSLRPFRQHPANCSPLTPVGFLARTAEIHPGQTSLIYADTRYNWKQTYQRCKRLAGALRSLGIGRHDTVSVLAFNTPHTFEAHFFVPMAGAVLNTINTRLDEQTIAYILEFAESRALLVDRELLPMALPGIRQLKASGREIKLILVDDPLAETQPGLPDDIEVHEYEALLGSGNRNFETTPADELHPLAINFTSGTSGRPKGVVYHHRGAYLMSMGTVAGWALPRHPVYLYSVPLFHCNGWGHAWTMTAMAATVVCIRAVVPAQMFTLMQEHGVTHFGGAPIVLNMLANAEACPEKIAEGRTVYCMTAGAPPPAAVLARMENMGVEVMHVYGLTETYGHILQSAPQVEWQDLPQQELAELKARQGVRFPMVDSVRVLDRETLQPVPADGERMGEIAVRANTVMSGYLKDEAATDEVFQDGWFWTGDLAVVYADGYIQLKDRAKDIIISGGENISSVEIENALYKHPSVGEAAIVAMPDEKWGERPCAFVELKDGQQASEQELIDFTLQHVARFKRPGKVVFGALPKTATGKIRKYELRQRAKRHEFDIDSHQESQG